MVLASERSNMIVLPTITSRTTVMTATLTTSWALSARSLWRKLSTLKCATVHTRHKVTHVALPNPDRSNRVAVARRLSQVRFRACKLNYFHQCGVPALSSGEGKSPFVCPHPTISSVHEGDIACWAGVGTSKMRDSCRGFGVKVSPMQHGQRPTKIIGTQSKLFPVL